LARLPFFTNLTLDLWCQHTLAATAGIIRGRGFRTFWMPEASSFEHLFAGRNKSEDMVDPFDLFV
jgi:hypothetical protein